MPESARNSLRPEEAYRARRSLPLDASYKPQHVTFAKKFKKSTPLSNRAFVPAPPLRPAAASSPSCGPMIQTFPYDLSFPIGVTTSQSYRFKQRKAAL
jgi:hypothetical protein